MSKGETRLILRLERLLKALTAKYQAAADLIAAADCYHVAPASAARMLRSDIEALRVLGFRIERDEAVWEPYYRLVGHRDITPERVEVQVKWCNRCASWKPLDAFGRDKSRANGLTIWCLACNNDANKASKAAARSDPERRARQNDYQKAYYHENGERARGWQRAYYERNRKKVRERQRLAYQRKRAKGET